MTEPIKLWARVGVTLEVTPEIKKQLEAGNAAVLKSVLLGKEGCVYLEGETYFPDITQNDGLGDKDFFFSIPAAERLPTDYDRAIAYYDGIVHGTPTEKTIDNSYTRLHASELIYCFMHKKDLLDFDMWTHCQTLLDEKLSFDEYAALDALFEGDLLELSKEDTAEISDFKMHLDALRCKDKHLSGPLEIQMVSVVHPGEHTLQDVPLQALKKGDMVFEKPFRAHILSSDYVPNPNAPQIFTETGAVPPSYLASNLTGSIHKVSCTISAPEHITQEGTILVNTDTGLLYRPTFPELSFEAFLTLMEDPRTQASLSIHGHTAPIYYDGHLDLYTLPSDLRPRPSLQELLNNADIRSGKESSPVHENLHEPKR